MTKRVKAGILLGLTLAAGCSLFLLHPISQSQAYNHFADNRQLFRIPNFWNVVTNLPFVIFGSLGLVLLLKYTVPVGLQWIYGSLFIGILLTGVGSAYYHLEPDDNRLVWDRIPMTIVFMSLLCATISELIDRRWGIGLWGPLILIGIFSVLYWHYGELSGHGDLRLYGLVQFYPMLFIPLIIILFYHRTHLPVIKCLCWAVVWYAMAKMAEAEDGPLYYVVGQSGHSIKHLAASASCLYLVLAFRTKYGAEMTV